MLTNQKIVFFGAGSMAEAMISGIVYSGKISRSQLIVTNRSNQRRLHELHKNYGITAIKREQLDFDQIDILILAMKPKDVEDALCFLKNRIKPQLLILSAVAGITTDLLEKNLPAGQQVIRFMPNTSSMISESATAMSPGKYASKQEIVRGRELLSNLGAVYLIDEDKMDIFTGIAGSGPAYVYYLMEHIEKAGQDGGFDFETARKIGAQTFLGAAKMIMHQKETPKQLREKVTSPNGTTEAGLEALEKHGGGMAMIQAVKRAAERSEEMSSKLYKQKE